MLNLLPVASGARRPHRLKSIAFVQTIAMAFLSTGFLPAPVFAVIIATGDGSGNTTAPAADPGWANVGNVSSLSGVYVRNGWVLTANHVGENQIILEGVTYQPIVGSMVRFQNPDLSFADLIAYKLQSKPPLPGLAITDSAPTVGTFVTMMGKGRNRGTPTTWDPDPPGGPTADGWNWGTGTNKRWGTNNISHLNQLSIGTQSFWASFDNIASPAAGEHEAGPAQGDSGGGVFSGSGASAELVGILIAQGPFTGQPAETLLYGNVTVAADLFAYRTNILAVIDQPDCNDGLDDDGDGLIDFPNDPGCTDALDTDESDPVIQAPTGLLGGIFLSLFGIAFLARAPHAVISSAL